MGVWILHDSDAMRAVFYDSTTESAIEGVSFIGSGADDEAMSFLGYLATKHNQDIGLVYSDDPRRYSKEDLQAAHTRWRDLALNVHNRLTEYGWTLQQWHVERPSYGAAEKPVPEPDGYVPAPDSWPDPEFQPRAIDGDGEGYDPLDPKHPDYADNLAALGDARRKEAKGE